MEDGMPRFSGVVAVVGVTGGPESDVGADEDDEPF